MNDMMCKEYFKTPARTGFLTHHLLQRCFSNIVDYETFNPNDYVSLGIACFYLATSIHSYTVYDIPEYLGSIAGNSISQDSFLQMVINVLINCKNIVATPTFWDYAHSAEDLPSFLNATVSCFYNDVSIPQFTNGSSDKNVLFSSIVGETNEKLRNDADEKVKKRYATTLQIIPIFRDEPKPDAYEKINAALIALQNFLESEKKGITFSMLQAVYVIIAYREYVSGISLQAKYVLQMTFDILPPKLREKYFPNGF